MPQGKKYLMYVDNELQNVTKSILSEVHRSQISLQPNAYSLISK